MTQYQERWIKGKAQGERQRDSAPRYEAIREILERYNRAFSVLDLGANAGYFTFRIAEDFPQATVIAVDDNPALRECAVANGYGNVIVIPKRLTGATLQTLARCERIDVCMALNVLHHIADWPEAYEALMLMAHTLIVETPSAGDRGAANPDRHLPILDMTARTYPEKVAEFPAHTTLGEMRPLFCDTFLDGPLEAQTMDVRAGGAHIKSATDVKGGDRDAPEMSANEIDRDYDQSVIRIERKFSGKVEERDFIPGMNLWNFALLGGVWPNDPEALVRTEVMRLASEQTEMDDLRPWNFILSGGRAQAIDIGWKLRREADGRDLETCLGMLRAALSLSGTPARTRPG